MDSIDFLVIGCGVVGLAIGRALSNKNSSVFVVDQENSFGHHTSSRNSEVIHAGIYYQENSLKALHCVNGKKLLYEYCDKFKIPHRKLGKLIVACNKDDVDELDSIKKRAEKNGVNDLKFISHQELNKMEPNIQGTAALLSPSSGVVDSHVLMQSLIGEIENNQGSVVFNTKVSRIEKKIDYFEVVINDSEKIKVKNIINAAGLGAVDIAKSIVGINLKKIPNYYFNKGHYFYLKYSSKKIFSHLVYPVIAKSKTNNMGTILGIHVTIDTENQVKFGPDMEWIDEIDYTFDESKKDKFYESISHYFPSIKKEDLIPGYTGIRPKIYSKNEPAKDFYIQDETEHNTTGLINLFGIESPGLTSSLSIGNKIVEYFY